MATRRPTKAQRRALLTVLSDEYELEVRDPEFGAWDGGFAQKTLQALVDAGWVRHKAGVDWAEAGLTVAGRVALGLPKRLPRTFRAALLSGIKALMRVELSKDAVLTGTNIPTMCLDEDTDFWLDRDKVRVAFDVDDLGFPSAAALDDDDADLALSAVSGWVEDRGFPVEIEVRRGYALFYDGDADD